MQRSLIASFGAVVALTARAPAAFVTSMYVGPDGGTWNVARNWNPSGVPDNGGGNTFQAVIPSGITVLMDIGATLDALAIAADGAVVVGDGLAATIVAGPVANAGTILLGSSGAPTDLLLAADVTFAGGGSLLTSDDMNNGILGSGGVRRLTNAADHAIRGSGHIGADTDLHLTNAGVIEATQSAPLAIAPAGGNDSNFNMGTLAADGGHLVLSGAAIDNTGGEIVARAGSEVRFVSNPGDIGDIVGGSIRSEGTGVIRTTGGAALVFSSNSISGTLAVESTDTSFLGLDFFDGTMILTSPGGSAFNGFGGTITDAAIQSQSTGSFVGMVLVEDLALAGTGELTTTESGANGLLGYVGGTERLSIGAGWAIRGGGQFTPGRLTNDGLIDANQAAFGRVVAAALGTVDENFNNGTMQANGGVLWIGATAIDNTAGEIVAKEGSEVRFVDNLFPLDGGNMIRGGSIRSEGSGLIRVDGDTDFIDPTFDGTIRIGSGAIAKFAGDVHNDGLIELNPSGTIGVIILSSDVSLLGDGELSMGNFANHVINVFNGQPALRLTNGPNHTIHGAGKLGVASASPFNLTNDGAIIADASAGLAIDPFDDFTNNGALMVVGTGSLLIKPGVFTNSGTVLVEATRTLTRNGDFIQSAGLSRIDGSLVMTVAASSMQLQGGTLAGVGTVGGAGGSVMNAGGIVAPGASVGALSFDGGYVQGASGAMEIEVAPAGLADIVHVGGAASIAGMLTVRRAGGYIPLAADTFTILTCAERTGTFDTVISCDPIEVVYADTAIQVRFTTGTGIPGDLDGDGAIDGGDLGTLLSAWGACGDPCCPADLNDDGEVDGADLGVLLSGWR